ncbi:hypothetical protein O4J55_27290 [Paracoccus sp. PXZ]
MTEVRKIMVDDSGRPLDGSELFTATRQAVEDGFVVNAPVILCYPNGREVRGHEARMTQKGLRQAAMMMARESGGIQ